METTTIAGTQVSRIGLGTWAIGGLEWGVVPDEAAIATCLAALDHGINLIDTAPIYGHGRSEEIIGRAIRAHGRRSDFYIATKAGLEWNERGVFANSTLTRLRCELEDSLRRGRLRSRRANPRQHAHPTATRRRKSPHGLQPFVA